MRGTHEFDLVRIPVEGIIPAHAGNTEEYNPDTDDVRDHPRACGEHRYLIISSVLLAGSSPRMRGTRRGLLCHTVL